MSISYNSHKLYNSTWVESIFNIQPSGGRFQDDQLQRTRTNVWNIRQRR